MKVDITQMLIIFDELLPATNEEQGIYWFKILRTDGLSVIIAFSIYEAYVDIFIHINNNVVTVSLSLENCSEIRVLDEQHKCLEILHAEKDGRCFLSLLAASVLEYDEKNK